MKPPNILVQTNCEKEFRSIQKTLKVVLQPNTYTIYQISEENLCRQPWMDTCSLLLFADCRMTSAQRLVLQKYVNSTDSRILFHNVVEDDVRRLIPFFDELELTKAKPGM